MNATLFACLDAYNLLPPASRYAQSRRAAINKLLADLDRSALSQADETSLAALLAKLGV